ncbi:hypothetical protein BC830DRAFT_1128210, partial [Chytriomyces sp. MP71]
MRRSVVTLLLVLYALPGRTQSPSGCFAVADVPQGAAVLAPMEPTKCMTQCGRNTVALIGPNGFDEYSFLCACATALPSNPATVPCNLVCPGAANPTLKAPCGGYLNGVDAWSAYIYGMLPSPSPSPSPSPPTPPRLAQPSSSPSPDPIVSSAAATTVPIPSSSSLSVEAVVSPSPAPLTSTTSSPDSSTPSSTTITTTARSTLQGGTLTSNPSSSTSSPSATETSAIPSASAPNMLAIISGCIGILIGILLGCLALYHRRARHSISSPQNLRKPAYLHHVALAPDHSSEFGDGVALYKAHTRDRFNSSGRSEGSGTARFLYGYTGQPIVAPIPAHAPANIPVEAAAVPLETQLVYVLPYEGSGHAVPRLKGYPSTNLTRMETTAASGGGVEGGGERGPRFMASNPTLGAMPNELKSQFQEQVRRHHGTMDPTGVQQQQQHYGMWSGDVAAPASVFNGSIFSYDDLSAPAAKAHAHSVADSSIYMAHAARNAAMDLDGGYRTYSNQGS